MIAYLYMLFIVGEYFIFGIDVPGYATIMCVLLFLGGIIELSVGIIGEYVAHIYMEAKDRPIFIVRQTNIDKEEK
jgi:hypothetical protein